MPDLRSDLAPLLAGYPDDAVRIPDHSGADYVTVLGWLHQHLKPKTYLEIGTQHGHSLSLAHCSSIAIDPEFGIAADVLTGKPVCHLFQMGSDEFFASHDPAELLNARIDFAFLDGMHWFEFLLRDFINTERYVNRNSVIALHDCVPPDIYSARRDMHSTVNREVSRHSEWWAGDVWKTLYILRQHRPDLKIHVFDAPPTGLALVTRLDPDNDSLRRNYYQIVEEMRAVKLEDIGLTKFAESLSIQPTSLLRYRRDASTMFWL